MRYLKIILDGFRRMSLGGVNHIEISPENYLQIILGSNGSGKSSLLKECSPLPGNNKDFNDGGYKEVTIEHLGKTYITKSEFKGTSTKCSFIDTSTNEELNRGGTQAAQYELANNIFGYSQSVHALINSFEVFTDMSPKRRREWAIEASQLNYDYVLSIWNKLRDQLRDIQGTIKQQEKRLSQEVSTTITDEEKTRLESEIEAFNAQIEKASSFINNNLKHNREEVKKLLKINQESLADQYKKYIKALVTKNNIEAKHLSLVGFTKESYQGLRDELLEKINRHDFDIENYSNEIDKLRRKLHQAKKNNQYSPESIDKEHNEIIDNLKKIPTLSDDECTYFTKVSDNQDFTNGFNQFIYNFSSWCDNSPGYSIIEDYFKCEWLAIANKVSNLEIKITKYQEKLDKYILEYNVLKSRKEDHEIECPNCHHQFIAGFDANRFQYLEEHIKKGNQLILDLKKEHQPLKTLDENNHLFLKWVNQYDDLCNNKTYYPILPLYLTSPTEKETFFKKPDTLYLKLNQLREKYNAFNEKVKLEKALDNLEKLKATMQSLDFQDVKALQEDINKRESKLSDFVVKRQKHQDELTLLDKYYPLKFSTLPNAIDGLKNEVKDNETYTEELVQHFINFRLGEYIREKQIELGEKSKVLHDVSHKEDIIKFLKDSIDEHRNKELILKIMIEELSPTKGLIAEGLSSFLTVFVSYMNRIIASIWSYPLKVCLPEQEKGSIELNYKFALIVGDNEETVDDVKNGSSGLKEVVNLAFKLAALRYMGLESYPLFLDEFGASFDHQHRINVINVIKNIIDQHVHSQIFIVSHDVSSYGAINNCDVCVLNKSNILIPFDKFNEHVVIS